MGFSQRLISRSLAHTRRMRTATAPIEKKTSSPSSPWLMLPPTYNDDTRSIGYNFYSLAENRVLTRPQTTGLSDFMPNPIHHLRFCGSSKGWIGAFNPQSLDLFLYNPMSLEYIKLPPIHNLPNFPKDNFRSVSKLILSCSPDEDEEGCRAVMIYNCIHAVAFCCPGRSKEWTPLGKPLKRNKAGKRVGKTYKDFVYSSKEWTPLGKPLKRNKAGKRVGKTYKDFVYSSGRNLFFSLSLNQSYELETWDLSDLLSPRVIKMIKTDDRYGDGDEGLPPKNMCSVGNYLVVADDHVLVVGRYVLEQVTRDGSYISTYQVASDGSFIDHAPFQSYPHITIGFGVKVYNQEDEHLYGVDSLGDLSLFIGYKSDAVALSATRFPELKPNSIYFTDSIETRVEDTDEVFGGHDIGIFNYENNTVSPCYYPCDLKKIKRVAPSPMWFFPTV